MWLATSMTAGAIIMALELVAFRLYAPYFGYSIYVWGSMISVVMAALVIGYGLGGWIADRTSTDIPVYAAVLASALYQLILLFPIYAFLSRVASAGDFTGTVTATLVIFAPSMIALAAVAPMVVRLVARSGHIGGTAGGVYAISTCGSIFGVLTTSFLLLPTVGTHRTLEILCAASFLLGASGLAASNRSALVALLAVAPLPLSPQAPWGPHTIWHTESAYNFVRVARRGDKLILFLNGNAAQTVSTENGAPTGFYYDQFALGPLLVDARRALALGMGGGGSIRSARLTAPRLEFDAVEIDPKVVEAAQRWFGISADDKRLHIHVADARRWLASAKHRYDLVQLDVYQGGPYIPFYLMTKEFFRLLRSRMSENSLLMMNLFDVSAKQKLLLGTTATLKRVFSRVLVIASLRGNYMIFAFTEPRSLAALRRQLEAANLGISHRAAHSLFELAPPASVRAFTDDQAPIEELTRRMLQRPLFTAESARR